MDKYIELYKEVFEVERRKSGIYSNLWTILIMSVGGLIGVYYKTDLYITILIIPPLLIIWLVFVVFNALYLKTTRCFLKELETKIGYEEKCQWFSKTFEEEISKKASMFLAIVIGVALFLGLGYVIYLCHIILKDLAFWVVYVLALGIAVLALLLTYGLIYYKRK